MCAVIESPTNQTRSCCSAAACLLRRDDRKAGRCGMHTMEPPAHPCSIWGAGAYYALLTHSPGFDRSLRTAARPCWDRLHPGNADCSCCRHNQHYGTLGRRQERSPTGRSRPCTSASATPSTRRELPSRCRRAEGDSAQRKSPFCSADIETAEFLQVIRFHVDIVTNEPITHRRGNAHCWGPVVVL